MKIEFTEGEIGEIVKDYVANMINISPSAVEFDCAYGYIRKVVVTVKMTDEDDSDA
jgi:hypothetical protein